MPNLWLFSGWNCTANTLFWASATSNLTPYSLRAVICSIVYAALWGGHAFLPPEATQEMWQWLFIGPLFFGIGALAALASLELDWGPATVHFSLYVLITVTLRWIAGFPPL